MYSIIQVNYVLFEILTAMKGVVLMEIHEVVNTQEGFEAPFESGVTIWCCLFCCCC